MEILRARWFYVSHIKVLRGLLELFINQTPPVTPPPAEANAPRTAPSPRIQPPPLLLPIRFLAHSSAPSSSLPPPPPLQIIGAPGVDSAAMSALLSSALLWHLLCYRARIISAPGWITDAGPLLEDTGGPASPQRGAALCRLARSIAGRLRHSFSPPAKRRPSAVGSGSAAGRPRPLPFVQRHTVCL